MSPSCYIFFAIPLNGPGPFIFFSFFQFYSMVSRDSKVHNFASFLFFFFWWLLYGLVVWPRLGNPFVCQSPSGVCISFYWTDAGLCIYHLFVWSNLNFLLNSQWITLPTQSYLVLYSFCANLLQLLLLLL